MSFALIGEARCTGRPFSTFRNGSPLSALRRTIELDVLQRLGEEIVHPTHVPDANGISM